VELEVEVLVGSEVVEPEVEVDVVELRVIGQNETETVVVEMNVDAGGESWRLSKPRASLRGAADTARKRVANVSKVLESIFADVLGG